MESRPARSAAEDVELVTELLAAAADDKPLEAILSHIVAWLQRSLDAAATHLWLTAANGSVRLAAASGIEPPATGPRAGPDRDPQSGKATSSGDRPRIVLDLPQRGPIEIREWAGRHGATALVSVPVMRGREQLGHLEMFFRHPVSLAIAERLREWAERISLLIVRRESNEYAVCASGLAATVLRWTPAAVIGLDRAGKITLWNEAAERVFGWRPADVLGRPTRIVPALRRSEFDQQVQQVLGGGRAATIETVRQRDNGATVDMLSTMAACHSVRGEITGTLEFLVDMTERRQSERRLRALLRVQEIAAGAQSIDDAGPALLQTLCGIGGWDRSELWVVDPEQCRFRRSSAWSAQRQTCAHESTTGPSLELSSGSGLPGAVWQQRRPVFLADLTSQGLPGLPWRTTTGREAGFGVPIVHRQQVIGVIALYDPLLTDPDEDLRQTLQSIAHVIGQFLELQRREAELADARAQLRQSQKMDAVGLLTGGIAHDFNNVLTVILSYSELAGEEVEPDHPAHEMLTEIFNAGQRAATMTRRLLTFSRRQDDQPVLINPNEMVSDIERMLRRLIGPNIVLETSLAESIGPIRVDAGQLEQVLVNFVVNARDAMPDGGRITISTHELTLRSADLRRHPGTRSGDYVGIAVTDTGCGMDEATRLRIFEPFFTTKAPGHGTGMGLATVAAIVKHCGGFIEVDTAPGQGTSIQVFLPRASETLVTHTVDSTPGECPGGTETIVVVEENATIRTLMRRIIQVRGYRVLEATDGEDALRAVRESTQPVSLVLTSVVLRGMTARELTQQLRKASPSARLMFLVDCTEDRQAAGADAAGEVLQKPFTSDGLARKIRAVLDGQAAGGE